MALRVLPALLKNSCSQAEWSFLREDASQKEVSIDDLSMCEADGSACHSFFFFSIIPCKFIVSASQSCVMKLYFSRSPF